MAGDKFHVQAKGYWSSATPGTSTNPLSSIVSALIAGAPGASGGKIASGQLTSTLLDPQVTSFLGSQPYDDTKPKAYLNWVLFDEQFKLVATNSSAEQIGGSDGLTEFTRSNMPIDKNGYLYIYVSNETNNISVFFDNLQVTHVRGSLLEESHYYPFGLTMAGISSKALMFGEPVNKYKYNGIEQNTDFDINMYDAFYRNLDPQIGRFWQIDPVTTHAETPYAAMQNNPIVKKDWLGNYFTWGNGAEERYNSLRRQNSQLLAGYVGELANLDLSSDDSKVQTQIARLQNLINMHGDLNKQWNEMEESDVEFHVSLATAGRGSAEGETGYNRKSNRIDVTLYGKRGNTNNVLAHELRHGYGYLNGEAVGGDHDPLYDLTDENVARNAGYLFLDRGTANLVADGYFTTEKFAQNSTTVPGSSYYAIRNNKISLTLNTPAAVLMDYIGGTYLKGYIQRNSNNINLTARDALEAVNDLDRRGNRPSTYVFGDALKNR